LIKLLAHARDRDLGDTITTSRKGRRDTASLGSWSVGESGPLAAAESPPAPRIAEERPYKPGEIDTGPRAVLPEDAAAVVRPRSFGVSDRFKRKRPSVIVRHGQDVQRIAPRRSPIPEVPKSPLPGPVAQESVAASRGSRRVLVLVILAAVVGAAATLGIVRALQAGPTPTTEGTPPAPAPVEPAAIEPAAIEPAVRPRIVLYFESDPPGAEVLDPAGEVIGVTPFKHAVERDPQQRVYTYRRAGYEIGSAKVSAQRTRKVHVALVELALEETAGTTGENALGATSEDAAQRRPSGGAQEDPSLDPTRPDATGRGATSEERGRDERRPGANLGELKDPFP
ncbi:MAG: hypothetical protein KC636_25900, partial [Myxococcales bacterium]|nr:hypothetical protein [Myxococcales bacterium]